MLRASHSSPRIWDTCTQHPVYTRTQIGYTRAKAVNVRRLSKQIGVWRDQKPGIERNGFGLAKGNTACYDSYRRYLINPDADRLQTCGEAGNEKRLRKPAKPKLSFCAEFLADKKNTGSQKYSFGVAN